MAAAAPKHVAVVFFHGMGSQHRYESIAELADRLDGYLRSQRASAGSAYQGVKLVDLRARMEVMRGEPGADPGRDVTFMHARIVRGKDELLSTLRFYEAYWAAEAVAGTTAPKVAYWLGRQIRKPWRIIRAPWRGYARLRRADLLSLRDERSLNASVEERARLRRRVARLVMLQSVFLKPSRRERYRAGTFGEFRDFVAHEVEDVAERREMVRLAEAWRARHLRSEWGRLLAIALLYLGVAGVLGHVVVFVLWAAAWLTDFLPWATGMIGADPVQQASFVAAVVGAILSMVGALRFLEENVGDVQQYVAHVETDVLYVRRRAILDRAGALLRHVLEDPNVERVVVVAHSLGTAVALDAMLDLWRHNRARRPADAHRRPIPLDRIHHVVTYGSPVDKINYFFLVEQSRYASYEAFIEDLRGDIGTPPFSKPGRQPHIHWINFWDRGDIVSGPIETVSPSTLRDQEVDNVRLARFVMPDLAASHAGYLTHRRVLRGLLDMIIHDALSVAAPPDGATRRASLDDVRQGPGRASRAQGAAFWLVYLLPVALAWSMVERLFGGWLGGVVSAAIVALLIIGALAHRDVPLAGEEAPAPTPAQGPAPPEPPAR